jgi:hypothetical protein
VALDARRGPGSEAHFAYKQQEAIPLDADLTSVFAAEIAKNREAAEQAGTVAAAVGVDAQTWRITRILLSEQEPRGAAGEEAYQILHLAKPLLDLLPL